MVPYATILVALYVLLGRLGLQDTSASSLTRILLPAVRPGRITVALFAFLTFCFTGRSIHLDIDHSRSSGTACPPSCHER